MSNDQQAVSSMGHAPHADLPDLRELLLAAATSLGGELQTRGLAGRLRRILAVLPGLRHAGLGVYDPEREIITLFSFGPPTPDAEADADAVIESIESGADSGVPRFGHPHDIYLSPDLARQRTMPIQDRLLASGVRRYLSVPVRLNDRLLGGLMAGFADSGPIPPEIQSFMQQLSLLVAPVLWNCHTDQRFRYGDRRRDTLVELGDAINTSLKLQTVLDSARQAIRRLEGHCFSAINVVDEAGRTFRSYRSHGEGETREEPQVAPVPGSPLEWIFQHRRTYQSDDLARRVEFAQDEALRALGVRRYVATPLFVRGRIIGCFLMGSADAHKALSLDVWLYENIALQLALAIDNATQLERVQQLSERLAQQNVYLREEIQREHHFGEMVGRTVAIRRVQEAVARVAPTTATVLILGETGVGKELVARAIHAASPRAEHPMVKLNCAAIPEGMVESELFGHERGAFTSAIERRIGRFELARDGTVFLDEVGELSPSVQAKLLRVLQDGEFERVGGTRTLSSNARVIAATNRNLLRAVEDGKFRSDLYYRLNVFPIEVPPLRQRREDIPLLVETFVAHFNRRMGKQVEAIDPASLESLCERDWPGNIRELRHVIERAMILCDAEVLRLEPGDEPMPVVGARVAPPAPMLSTLSEMEAEHIRRALEQTRGVIEGPRGAARMLNLKPSTLRFRMRRLGIRR